MAVSLDTKALMETIRKEDRYFITPGLLLPHTKKAIAILAALGLVLAIVGSIVWALGGKAKWAGCAFGGVGILAEGAAFAMWRRNVNAKKGHHQASVRYINEHFGKFSKAQVVGGRLYLPIMGLDHWSQAAGVRGETKAGSIMVTQEDVFLLNRPDLNFGIGPLTQQEVNVLNAVSDQELQTFFVFKGRRS